MSIAEMKLAAIDQINKLSDETAIKEILNYLEKINEEGGVNSAFLKHALDVIKERGPVLEKLAQ